MLTDAQVYCMTSVIYLFRPPLTAKAIYRKTAEAKCTPNNFKSILNLITYYNIKKYWVVRKVRADFEGKLNAEDLNF